MVEEEEVEELQTTDLTHLVDQISCWMRRVVRAVTGNTEATLRALVVVLVVWAWHGPPLS